MPSVAVDADFEADLQLDDAVRFPHPLSPGAIRPREVLLTGGTGFLGAYLLSELMHRTEANVHCLVRAADSRAARERIVDHLRSYDLYRDAFGGRIHAIAGDVSQPRLGLSADAFRDLAERIDQIYHSGGRTNMVLPYERLRPPNVLGCLEVLRLAGAASTKPVHFVSSIAVLLNEIDTRADRLRETGRPHPHASLKGAYSRTKCVAEWLVWQASERGLPVTIHRPVRITGDSRTGAIRDNSDILPVVWKACILLRRFPAADIPVTMAPVDYVSRAMIQLTGRQTSWGHAYHYATGQPIAWRRLMAATRSLGYPLREVGWDEWWQELKERARPGSSDPNDRKSFLATARLALTAPQFLFYSRPPVDTTQAREGLAGSGIECPPFDEALIAKYVDYWRQTGFLPEPATL